MSGLHGNMVVTGRTWLGAALAASGLIAASGPNPAGACHITHNAKPAADHATSAPAAQQLTPTPAASTAPTDDFHKALQTFLNDWHRAVSTTPPKIVPTMTTTATPPAAQTLAPAAPTVANQGTSQPCGCPPPPPCTVPPASTPAPADTTTTSPQTLQPPSGLTSNPATAPEPSTVVSALALIGAVAWRRRATRPGA